MRVIQSIKVLAGSGLPIVYRVGDEVNGEAVIVIQMRENQVIYLLNENEAPILCLPNCPAIAEFIEVEEG